MKKSDLKTGMIVELENGNKYTVLLGTREGDILQDTDGNTVLLLYWSEQLKYYDLYYNALNIKKVFSAPDNIFNYPNLLQLWPKKTTIEVSMKFTLVGEKPSDMYKVIDSIKSIIAENCTESLEIKSVLV